MSRLDVYRGLRVLVTGDTGFKGSWLCAWLRELGANVTGLALAPEPRSHFELLRLSEHVRHFDVDVRDAVAVRDLVAAVDPDIVFHLAAQALVRASYVDPLGTFATNVMGTANVLEALRTAPSIRATIIVTSDKCYENREWTWGYRENDRLGGHDPYSASKAAAELVVTSYRKSYFDSGRSGVGIASARAGNVIGGGDWSRDRLLPDCATTLLEGKPLALRNPDAVRPWQHVLEPVGGYLLLAARLLSDPARFSQPYNFGPGDDAAVSVEKIARTFQRRLQSGQVLVERNPAEFHEAGLLRLACEKAHVELGFRPLLRISEALDWTVRWYETFQRSPGDAANITAQQLADYTDRFERVEDEP